MESKEIKFFDEIEGQEPTVVVRILDVYLQTHCDDEEAYITRGLNHWKLEHRREAINDYLKALELNPQSRAKTLLQFANSILDFYSKDLLNP